MKKVEKIELPMWAWLIPVCLTTVAIAFESYESIFCFVFGGLWGIVGFKSMAKKGRSHIAGWHLGFWLGLIGLIVVACLKKKN